ncbi:MAG: hypothetical protein RSB82_01935 [Victivallaceae bacterium]
MTRMSKQARERHRYPRKRKLAYKPDIRAMTSDTAPIAYKHHTNAVSGNEFVFIPKIS